VKAKHAEACLILVLLLLAVLPLLNESAMANQVDANIPYKASTITINVDGSISPETGLINRTGNTYTLTCDLTSYQINIPASNIVFDGGGHTINVASYYQSDGMCLGVECPENTNVTIKNITIIASLRSIRSYVSSDCLITGITSLCSIDLHGDNNIITNCTCPISIFSGSGNVISKNNISDIYLGINGGNKVYLNNIFARNLVFGSADNLLDNGSAGNYWADYATRYPNASEIDHTGIGDTPYIINCTDIWNNKPLGNNTDNYPLLYPYDLGNDCINLPATPTPAPTPTATEEVSDSSLTTYVPIIVVSTVVTIAIVGFCLIYYQRKKKTANI
jgi:hypothetical protein